MLHALIAVPLQLAIGFLTGDFLLPAIALAAFYMAREHTQAEYRWIFAYGGGLRANMPWWGGFDPKAWTRKALLDWLVPVATMAAVVVYVSQA